MKKKILLALVVFAGILIILAPVFYLTLQKTQEPKMIGPNPTEEYQKFVNDKAITKIYSGVFPCDDCKGVETILSLSQADASVIEGRFMKSENYLEKEDDVLISQGNWITNSGTSANPDSKVIVLNPDDPEKIEYYLVATPDQLVKLDNKGNKMSPEKSYTLKLVE